MAKTKTAAPYLVRGERLEDYGVQDTPALRFLLDAVEADAFEAGQERGQEAVSDSQHEHLQDVVAQLREIARDAADAAADHAIQTGTHLGEPTGTEIALTDLRDQLEGLALDLECGR